MTSKRKNKQREVNGKLGRLIPLWNRQEYGDKGQFHNNPLYGLLFEEHGRQQMWNGLYRALKRIHLWDIRNWLRNHLGGEDDGI